MQRYASLIQLTDQGLRDIKDSVHRSSEFQATVEAAGGQVVKIDGSALSYNTKESFLNPYFFVFGDPAKEWLRPFQN